MVKARPDREMPFRFVVYGQLSGLLALAAVNYCDRHAEFWEPRFLLNAMLLWGLLTIAGGMGVVGAVCLHRQSLVMGALSLAMLLAQLIALIPLGQ
jgi:hypothetical protein